jgi:hypothetical protein
VEKEIEEQVGLPLVTSMAGITGQNLHEIYTLLHDPDVFGGCLSQALEKAG